MIPSVDHYWLKNAHIPIALIEGQDIAPQTRDNLCLVDLEINAGQITKIIPSQVDPVDSTPTVDLNHRLIFPCFVDLHTHLDKGHIWERSPNPDCTFKSALAVSKADAKQYWTAEDVYQRMEFGIRCSYAHGTKALRTHIDCMGEQAEISLGVFSRLQQEWKDRVIMEAVSLVSLDYFQTPAGVALADQIAAIGGILGGVADMNPNLDSQIDTVFTLAKERGLSLDFHVDETDDPNSTCLASIAAAAIRHNYTHKTVCGHCCSLAVQSSEVVNATLAKVKAAGIGIVSLPMCNLYLQDRHPGRTPRWRGVTCVHEIQQAGIQVTFASDNCRDPFHGYGDHDGWEVLKEAVKIAHLDTDFLHASATVTKNAADLMGLKDVGRIGVGLPADLVIFKARYWSELLSRSQHDRIVIRNGKEIDTTLPDYAELDSLILTSP